ncbi:MAG: hypothetical protein PHU59_03785 [Candidatus Omnitrophica bacterium]|jgi:hypothetical protein|nr:hypothetical protein [Candidatus Omnitrophota bacterium]
MKKNKWVKPKLVIIIRCKSEEGLLAACKNTPYGPFGPGYHQNMCQQIPSDNLCHPTTCNAWAVS